MIRALFAMLGDNMWYQEKPSLTFQDEAWEKMVDAAVENEFNAIVLDLGEGIEYKSHPELTHPGAWSYERVRKEVKDLKEKGIALIPKLNFSACHHLWLGEYRKMLTMPKYYEVCKDLINEVYELFDHPEYIHLGMDEEGDPQFFECMELVSFRRGELLWNDLKFLCDCVHEVGATPWIWGDIPLSYPEEFKKRFAPGSVVLQPWHYRAFRKENFTPIATMADSYIEFYKGTGYIYIEEDPVWTKVVEHSIPLANAGYDIVPCASAIWYKNNPEELVEFFMKNKTNEHMAGFMIASWRFTRMESVDENIENIVLLKAACDKYCKE